MIQQKHQVTLELENATLDLRSSSVSVIDSKSGNQVCISGLTVEAVDREVSYWVRSKRYAHNTETRKESLDFLNRLAEVCNEGIKYLNEQTEAVS